MRKLLLGMKPAGEDLKVDLGMRRMKLSKLAVVKAIVWTANKDRPWVRDWSPQGQCLGWEADAVESRII